MREESIDNRDLSINFDVILSENESLLQHDKEALVKK